MASRQTRTDHDAAGAATDPLPDGEPGSVSRRSPFSDNPQVGARGQRTQQRILDAALRVFGEVGYHACSVDRITTLAGCSRASFYQYFSSKGDVFRHLAGQLARQVGASIEAMAPLTEDRDGWLVLRTWITRYAEVYGRYEPVFRTAQAAVESDEAVAGSYARAGERVIATLAARFAGTLPPQQLDRVTALVLESLPRAFGDLALSRLVVPLVVSDQRFADALTDVVHRTFFGLRPDVNVHAPAPASPPTLDFSPLMWKELQEAPPADAPGRTPTLEALLDAGRDVVVARGYHGARIDDVVAGAGVSHGAFYRYFDSKDEFVHVLAVRAMRQVSTALLEIPPAATLDDAAGRAALRRWLRRYHTTQATEAAMIRVWADASLHDPALRTDSAAVLDWGRRRMADFLAPRGFGDVDTEAMLLVALLGAFGNRERSTASFDAAAHLVECGFLGR